MSSIPASGSLEIIALPAFADNYIWAIVAHGHCVVVDPGDAGPVFAFLEARQLTLDAILVTHHHADHTGGIMPLLARHAVPVYGPRNPNIAGISHPLADGEQFAFPAHYGSEPLRVIAVPGHTLDHIAYYNDRWLFCGDTLFAAGCGRIFEGTPAQMFASLNALAALPDKLAVYCAHEYTLANLRFALAVEPGNVALQQREFAALETRRTGHPTVPSTLALERATNPFLRCLRCDSDEIRDSLARHAVEQGLSPAADNIDRFAQLREWKNQFRA